MPGINLTLYIFLWTIYISELSMVSQMFHCLEKRFFSCTFPPFFHFQLLSISQNSCVCAFYRVNFQKLWIHKFVIISITRLPWHFLTTVASVHNMIRANNINTITSWNFMLLSLLTLLSRNISVKQKSRRIVPEITPNTNTIWILMSYDIWLAF